MAKSVTAKQVLDLVRCQGYVCPISGRQLTPETASLDHTMPLGRGGEHALHNICIIDHQINLAKGTMTSEEFIAMCREVVEYQSKPVARDDPLPHAQNEDGLLPGIGVAAGPTPA